MSKLAHYRALAIELEKLQAAKDALSNDSELKKEIEFEEKLKSLLSEYDMSAQQALNVLNPKGTANTAASTGIRKPREIKRYVNPHNGQTIETKGGNHKLLKEWKAKHGSEVVEGWLK